MANQEQLRILKEEGVEAWNKWREENPDIEIDLRKANLNAKILSGINLSKADLSNTIIRSTNFTNANLVGANFTSAKCGIVWYYKIFLILISIVTSLLFGLSSIATTNLDFVHPGLSYLKKMKLRKLLIDSEGQNHNFDRQDLRGINLQGANLTNASFVNTDLSQANLQEAILFEAKLVQTNLDKANLSNANLTAAYIENWGITRNTLFDGVKGDYVYQKLPTKYNRDPNRMPPSEQGDFCENDLFIFITSVLDTLDLYHGQNINATVALTVLKGLTEDYPVRFELAGVEKKGDNQYVMKLKVFGQSSHSQLQREYYARYEQILPFYDPKMLIPDTESIVAEIIKTVKENPGKHIEYLYNKGIIVSDGNVEVNVSETFNNDFKGANIANFANKLEGNARQQANQNIYASEQKQTLAEAAAEIQKLLKQLEQDNPTATEAQQIEHINDETTPKFKRKAVAALKAAGDTAIDEFLDNSYVKVGKAAIMGWMEA